MQVFEKIKSKPIGQCKVNEDNLIGTKFVWVIAEEGPFCQGCQIRHTRFKQITFEICIYNQWRMGLIADTLEDAKHLPGFREDPYFT